METVEEVGNESCFFLRHCLMAGNGDFLGMNAFGYREGTVVPLRVACLPVWRDRVVDGGSYTMLRKILLEFVATFA